MIETYIMSVITITADNGIAFAIYETITVEPGTYVRLIPMLNTVNCI